VCGGGVGYTEDEGVAVRIHVIDLEGVCRCFVVEDNKENTREYK